MSALGTDIRQSVRQFTRRPSFPLVAVSSLALAIAANGVVFGLVNGLILNPFTFPEPSRLVSVGGTFTAGGGEEGFIEQHSLAEIADMATVSGLEKVASFDLGNRLVQYGELSDRVFTALIVNDPVPTLGVPMAHGRSFTPQELAPGGPRVAIVSHRLWVSQFGSDPSVVGKTVRVNGDPATLVGVLGAGSPLVGTDLWIPWGANPSAMPRNRRQFTVIARLSEGASIESVNAGLEFITQRTATVHGATFKEYNGWRLRAAPWSEAVSGEFRSAGLMLLGAGVAVLLIACVNFGGLLLARLNERSRELAVRRALGAGSWQLLRLLLSETMLIWGVASVGGILLARVALDSLPALLPPDIMAAGFAIALDGPAALYCALAGLAGALAVTLIPAWRMRKDVLAHRPRQIGRHVLVVGELALAVALLVAAGLFVRSYQAIGHITLGFDDEQMLTMRVTVDPRKYPAPQTEEFFARAATALAAQPGVSGAAAANQLPSMGAFDAPFVVEGAPPLSTQSPTALLTVVSPNYFDVFGMPMKAGRSLNEFDRVGAPAVVVVNEAFSRRYLDGASTGRLRIGAESPSSVEVVGVVADARNATILGPARPEIFAALSQGGRGNYQYFFAVRTQGDPLAFVPTARRTLASLDAAAPMYYVSTMQDRIRSSVFAQRLAMWLVGIFGLGALVVAVGGVFGLVSFWVASRRREIGIRFALGGSGRQVIALVIGQTAKLISLGTVIGLAGGIGAGFAASSLLYGTEPTDPVTLVGVVGLLGIGGVIAAFVPAWRARTVNPVEVLRTE